MRRAAALIALVAAVSGCGGTKHAVTTTAAAKRAPAPPAGLRVGVVGPLDVGVPGIRVARGPLSAMGAYPLVLVSAGSAALPDVAALAGLHPDAHFAYVGGSTKGFHRRNLIGLVLRDDQAALLGGIVAGLVASEQGGTDTRVAWVGPQEERLAAAYADGVHRVAPAATVLHGWSQRTPARCKEAALSTIVRGAVVVMAHGGLCADAVASAAHEQGHVALRLGDFEFPGVPAGLVARDAADGVYHGNEDLVFGATSGAIGVRALDPRISADATDRARAAAQELASGLRPSG